MSGDQSVDKSKVDGRVSVSIKVGGVILFVLQTLFYSNCELGFPPNNESISTHTIAAYSAENLAPASLGLTPREPFSSRLAFARLARLMGQSALRSPVGPFDPLPDIISRPMILQLSLCPRSPLARISQSQRDHDSLYRSLVSARLPPMCQRMTST